ncbi:DUF1353 domain-containing protein [Rugamonas sp.]|uniref:DUF1353 domain-containing protein n=1 Tax=Rugamonas sp. TaxID=1926287 RepID=UPI0025D69911|nr:DUF1353 domain-containing protein [Rugamonas sp.]
MSWIGNLSVDLIEDDESGKWQLTAPLGFMSEVLGRVVTVPAGFTTDFCSVPRVPIAFELLGNRARKSGTIHDWLYTSHEVDRETADKVLREMLRQNGVDICEAEAFFVAVRFGGGSHWGPDPVAVPMPVAA